MTEDAWAEVMTYPDRISAEALLNLLVLGDVPARITSDEAIPGLGSFYSVIVPGALLHRARWLISDAQVSEDELTYLALRDPPEGREPT